MMVIMIQAKDWKPCVGLRLPAFACCHHREKNAPRLATGSRRRMRDMWSRANPQLTSATIPGAWAIDAYSCGLLRYHSCLLLSIVVVRTDTSDYLDAEALSVALYFSFYCSFWEILSTTSLIPSTEVFISAVVFLISRNSFVLCMLLLCCILFWFHGSIISFFFFGSIISYCINSYSLKFYSPCIVPFLQVAFLFCLFHPLSFLLK